MNDLNTEEDGSGKDEESDDSETSDDQYEESSDGEEDLQFEDKKENYMEGRVNLYGV